MHIGIDARMTAIPGGHGRYITNLVRELMVTDATNQYTIFVLARDRTYFTVPNDRWHIVVADVPWYTLREQTELPRILGRSHVDLMHFPHWNVPILYRCPFVVTIHDLTLLRFPSHRASTLNPLLSSIKNFAFKRVLNYAAHRSKAIITPSEFVKNDITEMVHVPAKKIQRVYEGIPAKCAAYPSGPRCGVPTVLADTHHTLPAHVHSPYLLSVGVAYPHKNLERTVDAFMQYRERAKTRTQFVIAGRITYFHKKLQKYIEQKYPDALRAHEIIFTGEVTDKQLNTLYGNARAFVYCSLSEGFGLPPLEALAHGVPVLASNTTCLPEILGDAALLVDPTNTNEITQGMKRICEDEALRTSLLAQAPEVLARYSWHQMARKTLAIYTEAAALLQLQNK